MAKEALESHKTRNWVQNYTLYTTYVCTCHNNAMTSTLNNLCVHGYTQTTFVCVPVYSA